MDGTSALTVAQGWLTMPRLGYTLEDYSGNLYFFPSKNELAEWIKNKSERQIRDVYGGIETTDRIDGSSIRCCFYEQSDSEVVQD